jgi:hypothetical protein
MLIVASAPADAGHARVAEFGRRTGLRIRRGNPWGFESPLSHQGHTWPLGAALCAPVPDIVSGGEIMKNLVVMIVAAGVFLLLVPSFGTAQYYGYYSPYYTTPPPPPAPPASAGQNVPRKPLYYRLGPDPLLYWKWNRYNAYQDFQNYQRSPLNPESDLSYMLRTF